MPATAMHLKRVGVLHTACGLDTSTWRVFWELPPESVSGETCPDCLAAAAAKGIEPIASRG